MGLLLSYLLELLLLLYLLMVPANKYSWMAQLGTDPEAIIDDTAGIKLGLALILASLVCLAALWRWQRLVGATKYFSSLISALLVVLTLWLFLS